MTDRREGWPARYTPPQLAPDDALRRERDALRAALERMVGVARGLIVSHQVARFLPGDDARLADQIKRAEADIDTARAALAAHGENGRG